MLLPARSVFFFFTLPQTIEGKTSSESRLCGSRTKRERWSYFSSPSTIRLLVFGSHAAFGKNAACFVYGRAADIVRLTPNVGRQVDSILQPCYSLHTWQKSYQL